MARRPESSPASRGILGRVRQQLIDRIRSSETAIIVISGPAGAGKSALVEAWARDERNVQFLSISRHHNAAASLLDAILAAVGVTPSPIDPADVRSWTERLTRALAAAHFTPEEPCRLVLDGVEVVTDSEAELLLLDLVENRPPALRLVATTRHRSPNWIVRSRACGGVTTIKADELRLRPAEVESMVGEDLPDFDGWALGVGLVAALGRAEAEEAIRDYLRNDVMIHVTTEMRHLLHAVSIAGETSPALAIYLTNNPAAGRLLAQFASTTQLASVAQGPVFQLHHALAKSLRDELATEHWQSYVALRRRHAHWLAEQGQLDRSTLLYVDLGAVASARTTLLASWQRSVLSGQADVLHRALDCLPPDELARDPRLCIVMAMANLAAGNRPAWRRWVDVAEIHADVEMEPGLLVSTAVDVSRRFAQALTDGTMPDGMIDHPLQGLWSAISEVANGISRVWAGDYTEAATHFRQAEVAARVSGDRLALVHALGGLALAAAFNSDGDAVLLADEAIAIADRLSSRCRWVVGNAYLALATVHLAAGSERGARDAVDQVLMALPKGPTHLEQRTRAHALELLDTLERLTVRGEVRQVRDLSSRERRVLRALSGPLTLREIADELFVSHNTVKSQVSSIFRKLDVHDRAAAVVAAARSRSSVTR